ncbi:hypothetical protein JTB14_021087 [Gonioctena quinquepunctata]|nr:hypothetical protein JTB14_021087 [Gonioctena quinquepunctata]
MNQEVEITSFKPTRKNAGINKSLSVDYIWPEKCRISNRNTLAEKADTTRSLVSLVSVTSSKGKVCEETVSVTSSKRSQAALSLRKMILSLKTEKVRQQLEKQQELQQQKHREVENQMRLIRLEHDLHEAKLEVTLLNVQEWIQENIELPATEENNLSPIETEEVCDVGPQKSEKYHEICRPVDKTSVMSVKAKQTSNNETSDSHGKSHPKSTEFSNVQASNEMELLCHTISETMKSVNPVIQEKILARQILDKDFPIFDGNPEDWSLFHHQFQRISTMCQYSGDEIMVKLRKSLRGEAKSSVSAMMMTSKNLELIMKTPQMQFGRPELIIDIILSKISAIPHMKELNIDKLILFSNK